VFGTTVAGLVNGMRVGSLPAVHQLWPYQQPFTWTPAAGLDDTGLMAFSEAIYGDLARQSAGPGERVA
jgi:hypothetical protein